MILTKFYEIINDILNKTFYNDERDQTVLENIKATLFLKRQSIHSNGFRLHVWYDDGTVRN